MVEITGEYHGELHCEAIHGPSGQRLSTDAPVDNQGRGEAFSPTDLCAAALMTCMATIMGIQARTLNVDLAGMKMRVTKEMATDRPRRIARLAVEFHMPHAYDEKTRASLKRAAEACPVHASLRPDIDVPVTFHWPEA